MRILPEEKSGFRSNCSTADVMFFVIHRVPRSWSGRNEFRCTEYVQSFIDLTKTYDSVDRTFLWRVLARFGVPQNIISVVIRQFHDGMRACVRGSTTGRARVGLLWNQGLRQEECVLAPLVFNMFLTAVMNNVAYTRFEANKGVMDALVHLRRETGAGGSNRWRASPGDIALGHALR